MWQNKYFKISAVKLSSEVMTIITSVIAPMLALLHQSVIWCLSFFQIAPKTKNQRFWQIWILVIWFCSPTDVLKMNWKNSSLDRFPKLYMYTFCTKKIEKRWILKLHHNKSINGILLPKLPWPTVRKKYSSDREKLLKLRLKADNLQKFWDH